MGTSPETEGGHHLKDRLPFPIPMSCAGRAPLFLNRARDVREDSKIKKKLRGWTCRMKAPLNGCTQRRQSSGKSATCFIGRCTSWRVWYRYTHRRHQFLFSICFFFLPQVSLLLLSPFFVSPSFRVLLLWVYVCFYRPSSGLMRIYISIHFLLYGGVK